MASHRSLVSVFAYCVGVEIVVDAVTKAALAEVLLQHAQECAALLVGEHVEHAFAVGGGSHLELDRAGAQQRVGVEGDAALDAERRPSLPIGTVGLACSDLHERGECLVEPDAVPPAHGHEVAEPHVGQLVCDHVGHQLAFVLGACGRVDQQQALTERDASEVLHGAGGEIGQCHQVDLVSGVGDAVVLLEPSQAEGSDILAEPGQVTLARHVHDSQRCAVDIDGVGHVEASDHECHQVAAHHHGVGERDHVAPLDERSIDLGAVRDRRQAVVDVERDAEHRLERRLVPAGKRPPAIGGLHLGAGDHLLDALLVDVGAAVEATKLVVEHPLERDGEDGGAGRDRCRRRHDQALGGVIEAPRSRLSVDFA